jgi:DNA-directed RNA polymerase specialized sigma24 family protein
MGDRDRAADVAQEVALVVVRRLDRLATRVSSRRGCTAPRCVRASAPIAGGQRQAAHERSLEDSPGHDEWAAQGGDIDLRLAIAASLNALSPRQRAAVILRYVHDLSDEDIAAVLRCRVGTVHALLSRARSTLRGDPVVHPLSPAPLGESR